MHILLPLEEVAQVVLDELSGQRHLAEVAVVGNGDCSEHKRFLALAADFHAGVEEEAARVLVDVVHVDAVDTSRPVAGVQVVHRVGAGDAARHGVEIGGVHVVTHVAPADDVWVQCVHLRQQGYVVHREIGHTRMEHQRSFAQVTRKEGNLFAEVTAHSV